MQASKSMHLQEAFQQLVSVVNALSILANDPDHGRARLRLVQRVQAVTESSNDRLVSARDTAQQMSMHSLSLE